MQESSRTPWKIRLYLSTRDIAVIASFTPLQFVLQFTTGTVLVPLPGAERPIVAFPVGFIAAITYILAKKRGPVGLTMLLVGLIQLMLSGFIPVIFEFVGGAIGAEFVICLAHATKRKIGKLSLAVMAGTLMLGRGIGVVFGLLLFFPAIILHQIAGITLLAVYLVFNGPIPFVIAMAGALAATKFIQTMWPGRIGTV